MMRILTSVGDMPAENGFGVVLGFALNGLLAMSLIFLVLFIMNKRHEKDNGEGSGNGDSEKEPENQDDSGEEK